jgi:hypothetical protein
MLFGSWSCAGAMPAFERGMGLSMHCRWYESYAGRTVYGSMSGFEWATRERPADFFEKYGGAGGSACMHPTEPLLVGYRARRGSPVNNVYVKDLRTGEVKTHKIAGPAPKPFREWSGLCVQPDKNALVFHEATGKKKPKHTWVLDLKAPAAWKQLELKRTTPIGPNWSDGMTKLVGIPGTDLCVVAGTASTDLWVLSIDRQAPPAPTSGSCR